MDVQLKVVKQPWTPLRQANPDFPPMSLSLTIRVFLLLYTLSRGIDLVKPTMESADLVVPHIEINQIVCRLSSLD